MKTFRSFGIIPVTKTGHIMMVCRKDTIGFMEFIKGQYTFDSQDHSYPHVIDLFNMMTKKELSFLCNSSCNFADAHMKLYGTRPSNKITKQEERFDTYRNEWQKIANDIYKGGKGGWDEPEWGFPKGKRNKWESGLECALRELYEETGIDKSMISIDNTNTFTETRYEGDKEFVYEYYLGYLSEDFNVKNITPQTEEISNVNLFTIEECLKKIRHYFKSRIRIVLSLKNILKNDN
jgi:8-oxo-dGTP pyrophosphatase MutT (NUDIX family)